MAFERVSKFNSISNNVDDIARYAIACVVSQKYTDNLNPAEFEEDIMRNLETIINQWPEFEKFIRNDDINKRYYFREIYDQNTGERTVEANWTSYYKGRTLDKDLRQFFIY